jgi:minor extracellular serine protease Vpr
MRRSLGVVSTCLLLASMLSYAQTGQSVPALDNETSGSWFVELESPPSVEGTALATLDREVAGFHSAASGAGIRYSRGRQFGKLWNGVTIRASAGEASKLRALPGVQAVYPVVKVALQQAEGQPAPVADLVTALAMTGADIAQSELGLTGSGVTVAVIDTGVDYQHPDLGGCFGRGCRVEKGFDFVGDAFDTSSVDPAQHVPHPDPDPDDCNGHGTHVAGIVGAHGGITGVAPGVKFHAYRVFGCDGTTSSEVMLAAMELALDNRADVVNMSIGSALAWPQYPTAQAADTLVRNGVVVVASIGNEGALGLYAASAPGVGKDVIGVASFDNTHVNGLGSFTITPDGTAIGYLPAAGAPAPPVTGSFPMARTGTATTANDACNAAPPLPAGSLTGKIALIRRGTCSFYEKAFKAQTAGAAGVVLYNNVPGFVSPTVAGTPPITIPVVSISAAKGVLIDGRLAAGPVTMTWTSVLASEPQPTSNLISSFSSYGPPADLSFKPDIGAPGGQIRSTLPLEQGGYGNISGTSMASPHVAGAVALLLEARPHLGPREVQERLQNTARPALWSGNPSLGFLDNVHRQGAGMLHIDEAATADAVVSPSSLALGEIEAGAVTKQLRISLAGSDEHHGRHWGHNHQGHDDDEVTYTLGHVAALSTGANTFTPSFRTASATVTFNKTSVTLGDSRSRADDDADVMVTIQPPAADPATRLFGGYITFTPSDGGAVLRVPYIGYNGDYQAISALTPTPIGFPWLAKVVGGFLENQPGGATFTLAGDDVPFILFHLDHQVRTLRMEVFDLSTGASVGFADIEEFLPRNSAPTSFFAFVWDGTVMTPAGGSTRPVPNGAYRLDLSVLKALGDPENPAHVQQWPSPSITISRP